MSGMAYVSQPEQFGVQIRKPPLRKMRRLLQSSARLSRTSATLAQEPAPTRPRPFAPRRPNISREHPRKWNRPLAFGVLPAYDEALKYIKTDSETLAAEARHLQNASEKAKAAPEPNAEAIQEMEKKLATLEIQSQINLPEVRWKVRNGMGMFKGTWPRVYI